MATGHSLPPGKNQSACWMSGSMMPTICSETVVIISVMFLQGSGKRLSNPSAVRPYAYRDFGPRPRPPPLPQHPSGMLTFHPDTLPLRLRPEEVGPQHDGHIARRHFIHVLVLGQLGQEFNQVPGKQSQAMSVCQAHSPPRAPLAPGSPDVVVVGFGQLLAGAPESLQPLLLLWDAAGRWARGSGPIPTPLQGFPPHQPCPRGPCETLRLLPTLQK